MRKTKKRDAQKLRKTKYKTKTANKQADNTISLDGSDFDVLAKTKPICVKPQLSVAVYHKNTENPQVIIINAQISIMRMNYRTLFQYI
ncbi:MAG: hypothetical protein P1P67_09160 [Treponema phagedenis]|uniref:Uncharacterized protein n=1 Tax=Treponema phagedenis TaxID=162 RepID=A0AAE6M980_TREPH|nr:hypothetical protein [Treponema phagedenis]QEJ96293.1 hypothetical protein FUT79_14520 [Treponema phagedenis]QEJ99299.1 hypothetical protein FUT82_15750 [Treponema phagedenis]QEK00070.1 hypothetical protein FUT84_01990 [Treponema phagedenis]QEK04870.1 hypothetical protein FUT83_14400 [Treponema phagedenis]QEK10490.1 hypothetical protein FUT81_14315 [Treponema phagedenis]